MVAGEKLEEAGLALVPEDDFCIVSGFCHWFSHNNPSTSIFYGENLEADFGCRLIGW